MGIYVAIDGISQSVINGSIKLNASRKAIKKICAISADQKKTSTILAFVNAVTLKLKMFVEFALNQFIQFNSSRNQLTE